MLIVLFLFLTLNLLASTPKYVHFVKFHRKFASCLLSWGKDRYVILGMRRLCYTMYVINTNQRSHFLCNISSSTMNLNVKFQHDDEKKSMGFHLSLVFILFPVIVTSWGMTINEMGTYYFNS